MTATIAMSRALHQLEQSAHWHPTPMSAPLLIEEMTAVARLNLAAHLLDNAELFARRFEHYVAWDRRPIPPIGNPLAWIKSTPLFNALVFGLPAKRNQLTALGERSRHEVGCANGMCGCVLVAAPSPATLAVIGDAARLARSSAVAA